MAAVLTILDDLLGKVNKIDTISKDVADIKNEVSTIRTGLAALEPRRVTRVEDRISSVEAIVISSHAIDPKSIIAEFNERSRRLKNIMMYNLFESDERDVNSTSTSIRWHDLSLLGKLFTQLLPSFEHSNVKTSRVGKKQLWKSWPLKVFLNSSSDVSTIMNNFSAESAAQVDRNFTVLKVYRDRTPRETEHLKRSDLKPNKD